MSKAFAFRRFYKHKLIICNVNLDPSDTTLMVGDINPLHSLGRVWIRATVVILDSVEVF